MTESSNCIEYNTPHKYEYTGSVVYVKDISGGEFAVPETELKEAKAFRREKQTVPEEAKVETVMISKIPVNGENLIHYESIVKEIEMLVLNKSTEEEELIPIDTKAVNELNKHTSIDGTETIDHKKTREVNKQQIESETLEDITTDVTIKKKIKLSKKSGETNKMFDTTKQKFADNEFLFRNEWQEKGDIEVELFLYDESACI